MVVPVNTGGYLTAYCTSTEFRIGFVLPLLAWRPGSGTARRPTPGHSGHQLADTNVVDGKWRLLTDSTVVYSLGLQRHFHLLTPMG